MPDVQKIEEPVGENHPRARPAAAQALDETMQPGKGHDQAAAPCDARAHAGGNGTSMAGSERTARRSSSRLTVAVPRFITTIPPA